MSEETTQGMDGGRSFEDRVFVRFDGVDSGLRELDSRLQTLEAKPYDTKPIWERALKEIVETRQELSETRQELSETRREVSEIRQELSETRREQSETRRQLSKQLDRIDAVVHETRADLRDAEDRIEKLESKS